MNNDNAAAAFEALRSEMLTFLSGKSRQHPALSALIDRVAIEIDSAELPRELPAPIRLPGCRHAQAAYAMAADGPMCALAAAFRRFEPWLRWIRTEHYRDKLGDDYMNNYCYTNILGYDALIQHPRVIAAFFIIGPGRHYPRHFHEAEEIYFPFGGDTLWSQNDEEPVERAAGEPIYNSPWLPHEMITRQTPLFTFCLWVSPGPIGLAQLAD